MNATLVQPADTADGDLLVRFVQTGDQAAFSSLVERHGPMVLGVCRRVLGNSHDAEDAFQATFLLLARRADTIRNPERLGSWLHGVARRTATKLVHQIHRRKQVEGQRIPAPAEVPPLECAWREVQQALDEEIGHLDGKLRAPLVLCYLEGKTHEEAAGMLGQPVGSMSYLLSRGLTALRERLARRGMMLTGGMSSLLLALQGPIALPAELVLATARAVATLGTTSPLVLLAQSVLRDLGSERAARRIRTVLASLAVFLGLTAACYGALASGIGDPRFDVSQTTEEVRSCRGKCSFSKYRTPPPIQEPR